MEVDHDVDVVDAVCEGVDTTVPRGQHDPWPDDRPAAHRLATGGYKRDERVLPLRLHGKATDDATGGATAGWERATHTPNTNPHPPFTPM